MNDKIEFNEGDFVVYPAHGVGKIEGIETLTLSDQEIKLYAISFDKERMKIKVPISRVESSGLRKISSKEHIQTALETLQSKSKIKRGMWSKRAQEYETKINSGDPIAIAEVLRDLKRRPEEQAEQSFSERQIYQSALERLAREFAAIEALEEEKASNHLKAIIEKSF
mgnify:CR=1 FL=1